MEVIASKIHIDTSRKVEAGDDEENEDEQDVEYDS